MAPKNFYLCLLVVTCVLLVGGSQAAENSNKQQQKDNMEHLFPLLFLMGGAPAACSPAVWFVGMLSLAVVWFVGHGTSVKVKNS